MKAPTEIDSYRTAHDFAKFWSGQRLANWKRSAGGLCTFRARLEYEARHGVLRQNVSAKLKLSGFDAAGKVMLLDEGSLKSAYFMTEFTPQVQQYLLGTRNELIIDGWSSRTGGRFKVTLVPI